jgi:predicted extracellular nuclease
VAYHIVHLFGGDNPLFGFAQPPVLASASQRIAQAQAVKDLVDTILACNPHANLIVLGDLNDFQCAPPVETLQGDVLTNLMQVLPPQEQYSYVFEGNSQVLDQMLVSAHLCIPGSRAYAVVHSNAEFATQGSDHDPSVARFPFAATLCSTLGTDRPPSRLDPELFTLAGHAGEEVPVR